MERIIYYDPNGPRDQKGFRGSSEAWWVGQNPYRSWDERFGTFDLSEALYWSLFKFDIVEEILDLPHQFILGAYEEGILLNRALADASSILRKHADALESNYEWQFSGGKEGRDDLIYRILVDSRKLREELIALAEFLEEGAQRGYDVQLWL